MTDSEFLAGRRKLLGDRIAYLRVKAGFNTKHDLVKVFTGSTAKNSVIGRIENGGATELKTIVRLAVIFKVPIYCFFDFEGKFKIITGERYNYDVEERLKAY